MKRILLQWNNPWSFPLTFRFSISRAGLGIWGLAGPSAFIAQMEPHLETRYSPLPVHHVRLIGLQVFLILLCSTGFSSTWLPSHRVRFPVLQHLHLHSVMWPLFNNKVRVRCLVSFLDQRVKKWYTMKAMELQDRRNIGSSKQGICHWKMSFLTTRKTCLGLSMHEQ